MCCARLPHTPRLCVVYRMTHAARRVLLDLERIIPPKGKEKIEKKKAIMLVQPNQPLDPIPNFPPNHDLNPFVLVVLFTLPKLLTLRAPPPLLVLRKLSNDGIVRSGTELPFSDVMDGLRL